MTNRESPPPQRRRVIPVRRKIAYSLICVVSFFVATETVLWAFGVQPISETRDVFVGFQPGEPLFVNDGEYFRTNELKKSFFNDQQFLASKPKGLVRVFSLGGSTTYGHPFDTRPSYNTWLLRSLETAHPNQQFEVINCGGISYASYRISHLMEELCKYQPDLFIVYTGHNEFLEERTYRDIRERSAVLNASIKAGSHSRTFAVIARLLEPEDDHAATPLAAEVDTILEKNGPDSYERDDELRDRVVEHYGDSLRRIVVQARNVGADVIFVKPASNIRDFSPFSSKYAANVSTEDQETHRKAIEDAIAAIRTKQFEQAEVLIAKAQKIDARHPLTLWELGHAWLSVGEIDNARAAFTASRDEDICPLRAVSAISDKMEQVGRDRQVQIIDYPALLRVRCKAELKHDILGMESFLDHVHPSIATHRLLGNAIYEEMGRMKIVEPKQLSPEQQAAIQEQVHGELSAAEGLFALNTLAMTLSWAGKDEEALKLSDSALKFLPDNSEVLSQRGRILEKLGRIEEAQAMYRQAIAANPTDSEAMFRIAQQAAKSEKYEEAIPLLQQAIANTPDRAPLQFRINLRLNLAWCLYHTGQKEEARAAIDDALAINPQADEVIELKRELFP